MNKIISILGLLCALAMPAAQAQPAATPAPNPQSADTSSGAPSANLTPEQAQAVADIERTVQSLKPQKGTVPIGNMATLRMTDGYRYLNPADTEAFLTKVWGNPREASTGTLGMILPLDPDPLTADGWAVIIEFADIGYVSDSDAAEIDYPELMRGMQQQVEDQNAERIRQGFEPVHLLGWARPPYYDAKAKKLFWAKRARFGNNPDEVLNYNIRILGRRGVLNLTVVAPMSALPSVDKRVNELLAMIDFNKGNTYAEYNASTDKVAEYGIAALIAGGVLAKAGFFKVLLTFLAVAWKYILIGLALAGGVIARFFRGLFGRRQEPVPAGGPSMSSQMTTPPAAPPNDPPPAA